MEAFIDFFNIRQYSPSLEWLPQHLSSKKAFLNGVICTILRLAAKVLCILLNIVQCCLGPAIKWFGATFD
jgi:hypothetical protein